MAEQMLAIGQKKVTEAGLADRITLQRGDATALELENDTFDAVTIAFGIRNLIDIAAGLSEMRRVLKPGGRALILEFSLPKNRVIRAGYMIYFRYLLPRIGASISGDPGAYLYLEQTVETFPYGEKMCALMRSAGFMDVSATPLTFGLVNVYRGVKR